MTPSELVAMLFPGKLMIPMVEAGQAIGLEEQTCYNMRTRGHFPLPVRKVGRLAMVAIPDLVKYLEGHGFVVARETSEKKTPTTPVSSAPEPQTPRRRRRH
ncbi:MAG: hypothetical protein ACM31P_20010 [Actinomycetota bacterium]